MTINIGNNPNKIALQKEQLNAIQANYSKNITASITTEQSNVEIAPQNLDQPVFNTPAVEPIQQTNAEVLTSSVFGENTPIKPEVPYLDPTTIMPSAPAVQQQNTMTELPSNEIIQKEATPSIDNSNNDVALYKEQLETKKTEYIELIQKVVKYEEEMEQLENKIKNMTESVPVIENNDSITQSLETSVIKQEQPIISTPTPQPSNEIFNFNPNGEETTNIFDTNSTMSM